MGSLHDDVGQPLYRLHYGLEGLRARLDEGSALRSEVNNLESIVREVDHTLRRELRMLHRGLAEDVGLEGALADLAEVTEEESELEVATAVTLQHQPSRVELSTLYRGAQEAITNVRKHAAANHVSVTVTETGERFVLTVEDDGTGPQGEPGLGLTTTRERFEALGGTVSLRKRPEGGAVFRAWLPVDGQRQA